MPDGTFRLIHVRTYIGFINRVNAATALVPANVEISHGLPWASNPLAALADSGRIIASGYERNDVVLYTAALVTAGPNIGDYAVMSVAPARNVRLTPTFMTSAAGGHFVADGQTYRYSATANSSVNPSNVQFAQELIIYFDAYDYVIRVASPVPFVPTYEVLIATNTSSGWGVSIGQARLLSISAATTRDMSVTAVENGDALNPLNRNIVRPTFGVPGSLTSLAPFEDGSYGGIDVTRNRPTVTLGDGTTIIADSQTYFILEVLNTDNNTISFQAFRGIQNVPTVTAASGTSAVPLTSAPTIAETIFISRAVLQPMTVPAGITFVASPGSMAAENIAWSPYSTVVDGRIINVLDPDALRVSTTAPAIFGFCTAFIRNADGHVTSATQPAGALLPYFFAQPAVGAAGATITSLTGELGVLQTGGGSAGNYLFNANTRVYLVSGGWILGGADVPDLAQRWNGEPISVTTGRIAFYTTGGILTELYILADEV
jgi:hypothetical protein